MDIISKINKELNYKICNTDLIQNIIWKIISHPDRRICVTFYIDNMSVFMWNGKHMGWEEILHDLYDEIAYDDSTIYDIIAISQIYANVMLEWRNGYGKKTIYSLALNSELSEIKPKPIIRILRIYQYVSEEYEVTHLYRHWENLRYSCLIHLYIHYTSNKILADEIDMFYENTAIQFRRF